MRFRVTNIKRGYCEVWANTYDGGRYQRLAIVMRDEAGDGRGKVWRWSAKEKEPPFYMPFHTYEFRTRRECVNHCVRTALLRQAQRAIDSGKGFSGINCPCRDALSDMRKSGLFSIVELHEMLQRMEASAT